LRRSISYYLPYEVYHLELALDPRFAALTETLHPSFERLLVAQAVTDGVFPQVPPKRGIYLFSERESHLYVGRSNNIRGRYALHCRPGATHHQAAFAFRLARKETGKIKTSYLQGPDSRKGLIADPVFLEAFINAKARIRAMSFRYVEENNPLAQCLLEVYAAVALNTLYNDFDNH
jgi:hypothetical protein